MTQTQEMRRALETLKTGRAHTFESAGGNLPREITAEQIASLEREIERASGRPWIGARVGSALGTRAVVDWNSKERGYQIGPPYGAEGCYLSCLACRRTVRMRWADIEKTWGVGAWTRDIARSLKCSQCGEYQGSIMSWVDSRPSHARDLPEPSSYPIIGAIERQRRLC